LTFFPAGAGDRLVAAVPELPRCLISASVVLQSPLRSAEVLDFERKRQIYRSEGSN